MIRRLKNILRPAAVAWTLCVLTVHLFAADAETERAYLSGLGPKDAVPWDFSVTAGRRAGEATKILVPSNWEQQGFGAYNYGEEPEPKASEHGLYKVHFPVPTAWKGRHIHLVFEGVMTDATVKVNGKPAGATHQGGFYRFNYDVSALVNVGADNLLEVDVAKVSANAATEAAERSGDYWIFGGIYRPVYLEALPAEFIEHAAIDALADGALKVDVTLGFVHEAAQLEGQVIDANHRVVGEPFTLTLPAGGTGRAHLSARIATPLLWTAETPNLYTLQLTLRQGAAILHTITTRFGFRTFEVRAGEGLFLNGQRILLKGVGRHSFRPETGRALTREDCYDDVRLIKEMNMNAARMTHYPPDEAFLEACDELGLYVLDELSGWHHAHDTEVGRKLVREMVTRDVNHPSILFWDNGNEGGWNRALDGEFAFYDPQNRAVLHPWEAFNDVDTKHYPRYADLKKRLEGPTLVMPTEMLHGLYDGGAGAGLEDYWNAISRSKFGAGGFIWVFADEGIVRTDQNGRVDVFSTFAPDGILGPHHEKEGSFFTIRDLYSPVQIDAPKLDETFHGQLTLHNAYDFNSLAGCQFSWQLLRFPNPADRETAPKILAEGTATAPGIAAHASGPLALALPANWAETDALSVVAHGPDQQELWKWTWSTPALQKRLLADTQVKSNSNAPRIEKNGDEIQLINGTTVARFDAATGLLRGMQEGGKAYALTNGPRLTFARPSKPTALQWTELPLSDQAPAAVSDQRVQRLAAPRLANAIEIELDYPKTVTWAGFKLEISPDGQSWKTLYDATRRSGDGKLYEFPPQLVTAVRLSNFRRSDGEAVKTKTLRLGYEAERFPAPQTTAAKIVTGTSRDPQTGANEAWLESTAAAGLDHFRWTQQSDGALRLDYGYTLHGEFTYHGVTFDHPEEKMTALRWLGEGPYHVWQNRLRGTTLGIHEIAAHDLQPGESWDYPEFQGFFASPRWARVSTPNGPITVTNLQPATSKNYLRIGTPRISHLYTTVLFPAGDLSFLGAIPAIGSKFVTPEKTGPASQPAVAEGLYTGSLLFRFGE